MEVFRHWSVGPFALAALVSCSSDAPSATLTEPKGYFEDCASSEDCQSRACLATPAGQTICSHPCGTADDCQPERVNNSETPNIVV